MPAGWVSAGVAAVGLVENTEANSSAKSAANKNNANAAQLSGAQGTMLNQAESVAQQPFTPYTGTLTAPMSGNQQQASTLASQTATNGVAQGDNAKATDLIGNVAGSTWNTDTAAKYMNPYQTEVNDAAIENANRTYLKNLAGVQTTAAGSGSFGGSREAIQEGELAGQNQLNIGSLTAAGNANAYNEAMSAWQADNKTKLAAADAYEQAGQDVTQMTSSQVSDLLKTGGVSQVISQTDLNNQYQQFMRQQGWSAQQLGPLINAVGTAKGSTTQTPGVQSNTANQILGLGSTIAGLYGQSAGSSSGSTDVTYDPTNALSDYNDANAAPPPQYIAPPG